MRRLILVLLACLVLASCSTSTGGSRPGSGARERAADSSGVDVDTPALRRLKADARVEPCARGTSSSTLPDITLPCLGGGPDVDLSTLRGPMVINLFAQWCGPCRKELPYYQHLHEKAKGTVTVLGVDYLDPQPEAALELARTTGVTYPLVADPGGLLRPDLKVRGLPGIVFVDGRGKVTVEYRVVRSYAELRGLVRDQLGIQIPA